MCKTTKQDQGSTEKNNKKNTSNGQHMRVMCNYMKPTANKRIHIPVIYIIQRNDSNILPVSTQTLIKLLTEFSSFVLPDPNAIDNPCDYAVPYDLITTKIWYMKLWELSQHLSTDNFWSCTTCDIPEIGSEDGEHTLFAPNLEKFIAKNDIYSSEQFHNIDDWKIKLLNALKDHATTRVYI